jgi:hypothetical protein
VPTLREVTIASAKVAIAVMVSGPVGALGEAANQAVDLFLARSADTAGATRQLIRKVAAGLEEFANSEGLDPAAARRSVGEARTLIARYGLTAMELVDAGLDPASVVEIVLRRGAPQWAELDEGDQSLVRMAVDAIYRGLLADPDAFPELTREFQRAVLNRLDSVAELPELTRQMLARAAAAQLVVDPLRWWRPDRYPTSSLLRAEYSVVPFEGRLDMLEDIDAWAADRAVVALRVYYGVGGIGKTRLLIEACRRLRRQGWAAGFLSLDAGEVTAETLSAVASGRPGGFVVVDYAETRTDAAASLLAAALATAAKTRVVLLARSVTDWWYSFGPGEVRDFLLGPAATRHPVPPLASDVPARRELFDHAARRFCEVLTLKYPRPPEAGAAEAGAAGPDAAGPDAGEAAEPVLSGTVYDRVLFIHLRALAATLNVAAADESGLLDFALAREQRFWDDGLRALGHPGLAGRPVRQAAALTTLAGSA